MTKWEYLTAPILTHAAKQILDTSAPRAGCSWSARIAARLTTYAGAGPECQVSPGCGSLSATGDWMLTP